jgi:uncharacterized membrane protein
MSSMWNMTPGYRELTPLVAIHLSAALAALVVGPVALWARKGSRMHRAAGYAWVTVMTATAASSFFIRDHVMINWRGFTPIHLLILVVAVSMTTGLYQMANGNIAAHRKIMISTYIGSCLIAGVFTLLPGRYLGGLVWHHWLGVV